MNVELLTRVRDQILSEPTSLDMSVFIAGGVRAERQHGWPPPRCGTMACIAGWAVILKRGVDRAFESDDVWTTARNDLEITSVQSTALFMSSMWPEPFNAQYKAAKKSKDARTLARITANRIDHFIREKE